MAMSYNVSKSICFLIHVEEFIHYIDAVCISQRKVSVLARLPLILPQEDHLPIL